jgi:hypothetical protein
MLEVIIERLSEKAPRVRIATRLADLIEAQTPLPELRSPTPPSASESAFRSVTDGKAGSDD